MTRTTEPPTVPGWYWLREANDPAPQVVQVCRDPPRLVVYEAGYESSRGFPDGAKWAGPLVPPT